MPRMRREVEPGQPHHITQRGNNRQIIFQDDFDRGIFLTLLKKGLERHEVKIEAFSLMPNHVHEILTPPSAEALALCMKETQSDYARAFNRRHLRSGHLWQNRFFACPLGPEHLYRAMRYVELNPVRAGIVEEAWEYAWSSAAFHAGLCTAPAVMERAAGAIASKLGPWDEYLRGEGSEEDRLQIRTCTSRGIKWDP